MKYVKFEEKIKENIVKDTFRQNNVPTTAMVLRYDREKHEVDIVTEKPGSNQLGEIFRRIPCPQFNGVQTVAPEAGRPCRISFPDGVQSNPVVISFFNPFYRENDYEKQGIAVNDTPRFMTEL